MRDFKKFGDKIFILSKDENGYETFEEVQVVPRETFAELEQVIERRERITRNSFRIYVTILFLGLIGYVFFMKANPGPESINTVLGACVLFGLISLAAILILIHFPEKQVTRFCKKHKILDPSRIVSEEEISL